MNFEKLFSEYSKTDGYKKLSENSVRSYIYASEKLIEYFGDRGVETLKRSDFIKLKDDMCETPGSANLVLRIASVMFGYAMDRDILPANPVANMKKYKLQGHEKWTPEEVKLFVAQADLCVATAIYLAWYTGQRQADILKMKTSDYSDGYISLVQKKTKKEVKIKVHPDLEDFLRISVLPYRKHGEYLISGPKKMSGQSFRHLFHAESKRLGVEKVFHGIRKGVASSLAENGRPISEIAAILGHKSIRMAAYYAEQADGTKLAESAVSNLTTITVREPC